MTNKYQYIKDLTDYDERRKSEIEEFKMHAESTYRADIKAAKEEIAEQQRQYNKKWSTQKRKPRNAN